MRVFSLYILVLLMLAGCAGLPADYRTISDGKSVPLSLEEILRRVENERVIFIGEGHTRAEDHLVQIEVIKHLHEKNKNPVVALEMFTRDHEPYLAQWVEGTLTEKEFKDIYYGFWNVPYKHYKKIFAYTRQKEIPMTGINARDALIKEIARGGPSAIPAETLRKLKFTDCTLHPDYKKTLGLDGNKIKHEEKLPYLCEAQRLRDTIMAYSLMEIIDKNESPVIVLLGAAHASKIAVPKIFSDLQSPGEKQRFVVLMPAIFKSFAGRELETDLADYIWF